LSSCWSCLVILEDGATVCPLCGADQTHPVKFVDRNAVNTPGTASLFHEWRIQLTILVCVASIAGGIYWHNFGGYSISRESQAAAVAAKSLRAVREALSDYALSNKGMYPDSLNSVSDRVSGPMQAALDAGYALQYRPNAASGDAAPRSFVILARPERGDYWNLCIDESGVVRATEENRPATMRDPLL
jgi:hypothetical protein